ncbi:hybrid sensor histidine kinase/response regulator [Rhizobium sp. YIM 134829]|uniref:hybrid sensor histidine kinase/response regulator n=1 Tax=Rhizobium sp. YIM 134829 TaxID=3390453 RepID=UPI00397B2EEB
MSALSKLEEWVSEATRGSGRRPLHPPVPRSAEPSKTALAAWRPALLAAGILSSAAVLGLGIPAGSWTLPAGLALAGLTGTALLFLDGWQAMRRSSAGRLEDASDAAMERRESLDAMLAVHDRLGDIAVLRDGSGRIVAANRSLHDLCAIEPEGRDFEALGLQLAEDTLTGQNGARYQWQETLVRNPADDSLAHLGIGRRILPTAGDLDLFSRAIERAQAESRDKSQLLATVSHEIRTPLSGILGMCNLFNQTRLSAEQANYLAGMRQAGHTLVQLVDDLLDFSSLEAGRFTLKPTRQPVRPAIESVVEMLSHRAHEKGIEIASTVAADVPDVLEIDAPRLKQVLFNVIGNAVKFTQTGGVLVSVTFGEADLVVTVADTGPGMTPDEQARIFEAFEQAGDAARRSGGTGLGLAISRRIMVAFGGSLTVASTLGQGSIFTIRLPIAAGTRASPERRGLLAESAVLLIAPKGPAATALQSTITALGGRCRLAHDPTAARQALADALSGYAGPPFTDIIIDHRHAVQARALLASMPAVEALRLRRTYLVNPEERGQRPLHQTDGFNAWLIRPLRERSLVEVLKGRMRGIELRDATNDNRPVLRAVPAEEEDGTPETRHGILLGEDDPVNGRMLMTVLGRAGHAVTLAEDFATLRQHLMPASAANLPRPSLVLTDLNMPGGDGLTMLRQLRMVEICSDLPRLPVIIQTSDARPETRRDLIEAGADEVLVKPADPANLLALISQLATAG